MTAADEAGVHYGVELSKTNKSKCPVCHSYIQKGAPIIIGYKFNNLVKEFVNKNYHIDCLFKNMAKRKCESHSYTANVITSPMDYHIDPAMPNAEAIELKINKLANELREIRRLKCKKYRWNSKKRIYEDPKNPKQNRQWVYGKGWRL